MTGVGQPPGDRPGHDRTWPRVVNFAGLVLGLIGAVTAVFSFPSTASKVVAAIVCCAVVILIWQAARDWDNGKLSRGMLAALVSTAVTTLALIVVLTEGANGRDAKADSNGVGSQANDIPSAQRQDPNSDPTSVPATSTPSGSLTPSSDGREVWLSDLEPLENGDRWDVGPITMGGKVFERSLTGDACNSFSNSDVTYNIFRRYGKLRATIGFSESAATGSEGWFAVIGDERELYSSERLKPGDVRTVDISLKGIYRLSLRATAGCAGSGGTWGDVRLSP